jgi:feruloyl esterase
MEAQRFPDDYDGIVAGAPANPMSLVSAHNTYVGVTALKDPAHTIPATKYALVHDAVLNACDALDGVKDGLLTDPTRCHFDPTVLQCKGDDGPTCLTAAQVETAKAIYGPVRNPRTGKQYSSGLEPGTEMRWNVLAGGPQPFSAVVDYFRYVVHQDPNWDWRSIDFDKDVEAAVKNDKGRIDATKTTLGTFTQRGGKLLMFHGWADQNIAPRNTIEYVKSVQRTMGGAEKTADSLRLFMVPGMGHCRGGEGPSTIDWIAAIDQWVDQGKAPERIIATHLTDGKPDRTRPLCPYPQIAVYKGSGSTDDERNFICN